jgi:predicted transcriptional regulator
VNPKLASFLAPFSPERRWGQLDPLEYALLSALWEQSPATLRDLHRDLRSTPYKTMVSALDRLYKDGLVRRERETRLNAYSPTMSRQELEAAIVASIRPS